MSELNVDTINEQTAANGVTIDSVLIKDGQVDGVDVSALNTTVSSLSADTNDFDLLATTDGTSGGHATITYSNLLDKTVYNSFQLVIHGFRATSGGAHIRVAMLDSSDNVITGTYTMGYRYTQVNGSNHSNGATRSSSDYWYLFGQTGNNGDTHNCIMNIFPEDDIYHNNQIDFIFTNTSGGNTYHYSGMMLAPGSATAFKGIKLYASAGNLDITQVSLYGRKH